MYWRSRILAWGANLFAVHDKNFRKCQCWALAVMSLPRQMIISVHGTTITEYQIPQLRSMLPMMMVGQYFTVFKESHASRRR